jgi:rod shape-determining protein MreC
VKVSAVRSNGRSRRSRLLILLIFLVSGIMTISYSGVLRPLEDLAALPINWVTERLNNSARDYRANESGTDDPAVLKRRMGELEEQLARIQAEVIQLREVEADYERLTGLLGYTSSVQDQEFVTADVIGIDQESSVRSIIINRGTRDGVRVGMPVVTELGLVGRIFNVSADVSQVQLIVDRNSAISGRLQQTRAEGSVQGRGLITGNLEMLYIDPDAEVNVGDLVVTSGLGGNMPPDLIIGQVSSRRNFESELSQEAEVRSFVDFNTLEFVLVVTSFEPADISVFDDEEN